MKFKYKALSNRLVTMRTNMKNDANHSLFTSKERYKMRWDLRFKDESISNRFLRDCADQSVYLNKLIMFPKWLGVYALLSFSLNNELKIDLTQVVLTLIIPIIIESV